MKKVADPRLHLSVLTLVAICTLVLQTAAQLHVLLIFCVLYVAAHGRVLNGIRFAVVYAAGTALFSVLPATVGSVIIMLFLALRTMPMLAIGSLLWSSPPGVIMTAGGKMHMPKKVLVMICIIMRFIPVIRQEMQAIGQGIRARGLLPHWYSILLHPARSYECFVLPLIIRGLRLSSEITCAAEFRGLESTLPRSSIYTISSCRASIPGFLACALFCSAILLMPRWIL